MTPTRPRWVRGARNAGGLLLVITSIPLVVLPFPAAAPAVFFGLNLLKDDFVWANRLLGRLHTTTAQLRSRFPKSRFRLAQAALRRQLFMRRSWFWQPPAEPPRAASEPASPAPASAVDEKAAGSKETPAG